MADPGLIAAEVAGVAWYHTIDLPEGVVTPGYYDPRPLPQEIALPAVTGRRCLDVGSATGFWAFEMERRGAAEVVSLDLEDPAAEDWPSAARHAPGGPVGIARSGFEIAARHLDSSVRRVDGSVYDLSAEWLGEFDVVFVGNLLLHLSDPVGALRRIAAVCRGEVVSLEVIALTLSLLAPRVPLASLSRLRYQQWWVLNRRAHRTLLGAAGLTVVDGGPVRQMPGAAFPRVPLGRIRRPDQLRLPVERRRGVASQWLVARPDR